MVNPTGKHRPKKRHHGDGTIVKRKDAWRRDPWLWTLRRTIDGKRVTVASCSGTSRDEVDAEARRILARLDRPRSGMTVAELLDRWLQAKRGTVKPSAWDRYRSTIRAHRERFADVTLDELTPDGVRERLTGTANQRNLVLLRLRSAVAYAIESGWLDRDPTKTVAMFRHETREAPTVDWQTANRILAACRDDQWGAMVALAMLTGLRRGELLALRWQDIADGAITVRFQLRRTPPEFRAPGEPSIAVVDVKTRKSRRVVPVTELVAEHLERQRKRQATAKRRTKVWAPNDLVFANEVGEPVWPVTATRHAEDLIRTIVPGMRLHDLRHAWETLLSSAGASERVRMGLAGHATAGQTLEYTHVIPDDAREAADRMHRRLAAAK